MKVPEMVDLKIPQFKAAISTLSTAGKVAVSNNNLIYLDIDDEYIHQLFPLLSHYSVNKPNYFGKHSAGAHITIIYPEENVKIKKEDIGLKHEFLIKNICTAQIGLKTYYVVIVESPSLLQLRRKYSLSDLLCFKGYAIGFHITIGVSYSVSASSC